MAELAEAVMFDTWVPIKNVQPRKISTKCSEARI